MQTGITQDEFEAVRKYGTFGSKAPAYMLKKYRYILEKHKDNPEAIKELNKAKKEGSKATKKRQFRSSKYGKIIKNKKTSY